MRIVLTGHKGFIGHHYLKHIKDVHDVTTYDIIDGQDLKDKAVVDNMPDCDVVVHMAATNGTKPSENQKTSSDIQLRTETEAPTRSGD